MKSADERYVETLTSSGYHSRSSKHGDALCLAFLDDFLEACPAARTMAEKGELVYRLNHTIDKGSSEEWSMDLVLGPPKGAPAPSRQRIGGINEGAPAEIWLALDAKGIMTEHGKARRNRARDVTALYAVLHAKHPNAVVGACLAVNISPTFESKLLPGQKTVHKHVERLVEEIVSLFAGVPEAGIEPGKRGLEGLGIIVVDYSGRMGDKARLVTALPAPPPGHRLHYQTMLRSMAAAFGFRHAP